MNWSNVSTGVNNDELQQLIDKSCSKAVNDYFAILITQLIATLQNNGTIVDPSQISVGTIEQMLLAAEQGNNLTTTTPAPTPPSSFKEQFVTLQNNSNIFFLLVTGIFIYFMQTGFALLEIGIVRNKNVSNSVWKNVTYSCM